jgi:hypothetical protein
MDPLTPTNTAIPPSIPPPPQPPPWSRNLPLGDSPEDREPVPNAIAAVEAILRHPRRIMYQLRQPGSGQLTGAMILVSIICALVYGVVVGTFSMGDQLWAAPVKIASGLLISALICLPSLYIFGCLSGSRARLAEMFGLVAGLLMLMTILLIGFAPVAWLFSQSTDSLPWMGALHLIFWFIATIFGLRFLSAGFSHSQARSNAGLATWMIIFILVAVQMTTALRPIVGKSNTFLPKDKRFFLAHWGDCLTGGAWRETPATNPSSKD